MSEASELFDYLTRAYEAAAFRLTPDEWPQVAELLARLDREGMQAADRAERHWLHDLEQRAAYALAIADAAGPGRGRAAARARLTDAFIRSRRPPSPPARQDIS